MATTAEVEAHTKSRFIENYGGKGLYLLKNIRKDESR